MWNGTMFVDLDWPLNASSPLSASADLLVLVEERARHGWLTDDTRTNNHYWHRCVLTDRKIMMLPVIKFYALVALVTVNKWVIRTCSAIVGNHRRLSVSYHGSRVTLADDRPVNITIRLWQRATVLSGCDNLVMWNHLFTAIITVMMIMMNQP